MEAKSEERGGVVQPKPYKAKKDAHKNGKGKSESVPTCDRDINCLGKGHIAFQCPNRKGNGEVEYESDRSESKEMSNGWFGFDLDEKKNKKEKKRVDPWVGPNPIYLIII
jgi:hypothetical protein